MKTHIWVIESRHLNGSWNLFDRNRVFYKRKTARAELKIVRKAYFFSLDHMRYRVAKYKRA